MTETALERLTRLRDGGTAQALRAATARRSTPPLQGPAGGQATDAAQGSQAYREGLGQLSALSRPGNVPDDSGMAREARGEGVVPFMQPPPVNPEGRENLRQAGERLGEAGERVAALLNMAGEGMTLGLVGDEAAGRFDAMIGRGGADERTQFYRDQQARTREEMPVTSFVAETAPAALVPGGAAARFVARGATRGMQMLRSGLLGAGAGATYGAMEGDGDIADRAEGAAWGAAGGGLFGAFGPRVLEGIPRGLSRLFRNAEQRPTVEALRTLKNAAYQTAERAGIRFSADDMTDLSQRVRSLFEADNYVDDVDDASRATLRLLERREGQETTLQQLDRIRQNLWTRYSRANDQPRILDAIGAIDDLIEQSPMGGALMDAARAANSRFSKAQVIEDAFERARRQTARAGSGGNIVNNYRAAVDRIINSRAARFFSDEELDVMRGFVLGSTGENLQRLIGKLSPTGNGLMMSLHVIGGVASNGMSLPLMAVGAGSKALADRGAMRGADAIQDVVSGFRTPAQTAPHLNGPAVQGALAAAPQVTDRTSQPIPWIRNRLSRD